MCNNYNVLFILFFEIYGLVRVNMFIWVLDILDNYDYVSWFIKLTKYILFHLILKGLKLVLHATLFRDCCKYRSNWWYFTYETCKGYISRFIFPPTSIMSYDYVFLIYFGRL